MTEPESQKQLLPFIVFPLSTPEDTLAGPPALIWPGRFIKTRYGAATSTSHSLGATEAALRLVSSHHTSHF